MGIASKMIKKMVSLAFERLELEKIVAGVYATNLASIRVLKETDLYVRANKGTSLFSEDNGLMV